MQLIPNIEKVKRFLIIFYLVGIFGFLIPYTEALFNKLIPIALLINVGLLIYFHQPKSVLTFALMAWVAILGFAVEVIGVKTGILFGNYWYGAALGPKFLQVPLMIGVNWFFLTYSAAIVTKGLFKNQSLQVLIGASMVTFYDFVMEPVAMYTHMWNWQSHTIPIKNYVMWFILSALFIFIFSKFGTKNKNPLATHILFLQFLFFVILHLTIKYY
jgi:putative membrane protein